MALRSDRNIIEDDISFYMNETAERGKVVMFDRSVGGSGSAMDNSNAVVKLPAGNASGNKPAGILLNDVVDLDLTRQHVNFHKDEVQVRGKVRFVRRGWVVTNNISGTPSVGDPAYMGNNGEVTPTNLDTTGNVRVGTFLSKKDSDSYAKVEVNL
jgi:hypothetical protein